MTPIFRLGVVPVRGTMQALQRGQAIYFQGRYLCEVVADLGESVSYIVVKDGKRGQHWTAAKDLFTLQQELGK